MCGIFGFFNTNTVSFEQLEKPLEKLIKHSHSRGKEAAGLAVLTTGRKIEMIKSDLDVQRFMKSVEYLHYKKIIKTSEVSILIGHSRIATHGSQLNSENNQPVLTDDLRIAGVHNGIVTNSAVLWNRIKPEVQMPVLDTVVLFNFINQMIDRGSILDSVDVLFEKMEGAASIAFMIPELETLVLASNTGSLYYYTDEVTGASFFASEKPFLTDTFPGADDEAVVQVRPGTVTFISRKGISTYDLKQYNKEESGEFVLKDRGDFKFTDHSVAENKSNATHHYTATNQLSKLKKHDFQYERIYAIKRCTRCILPATTPFIVFDKDGICNYCHEHQKITYKGGDALEDIVAKYRKGNGKPDCLAAFSGGRDSSYGLHYLKKELGLQPLAYTYDWGMVTDMARRNQARILGKLGVEHIVVSADITQKRMHIRKNILAWMKNPHLGMVPLFMEGDKQCEFYADQLMKKYKLPLMFFFRGNELERGEFKHGHCGVKDADPNGVIHNLAPFKKVKMLSFYAQQYFKNPAYFNTSFFDTSLAFFSTYIQKHNYLYLWHYIKWDEQKIVKTITEQYNWESCSETKATWRTDDGTSAFYNYIYYHGQGFTENDSFRARQVREHIITRKQALEFVNEENKPRYDSLKWYFDLVALDGDQVLTVVDNMKTLY